MDLDPKQMNFLPESTREKLLNPIANEIGQGVGNLFKVVLLPLNKVGIWADGVLENYRNSIQEKLKDIPEDNLDKSKLPLVLREMEESRYQINDDTLREMFAKLIVASVNKTKNSDITPQYSLVLSQLGPNEAKFLMTLYYSRGHQLPSGELYKELSNSSTQTVSKLILLKDNYQVLINVEKMIDTLVALGLLKLSMDGWLSSNVYENSYLKIKEYLLQGIDIPTDNLKLRQGYVRLTAFGESLLSIVLE